MRYFLRRNMQLCQGGRSCGLCIKLIPPLKHGEMAIGTWVPDDPENEKLIDRAITECPTGAMEIVNE